MVLANCLASVLVVGEAWQAALGVVGVLLTGVACGAVLTGARLVLGAAFSAGTRSAPAIGLALAGMAVCTAALVQIVPPARDAFALLAAQDDPPELADLRLNSALRNSPALVAAGLARFGRIDSAVAFSGDIVTGQFGWELYRADRQHWFPIATNRYSWPLSMPLAMFSSP